jgi:peptidoglycan-N-acetylglucosamine deacetylase
VSILGPIELVLRDGRRYDIAQFRGGHKNGCRAMGWTIQPNLAEAPYSLQRLHIHGELPLVSAGNGDKMKSSDNVLRAISVTALVASLGQVLPYVTAIGPLRSRLFPHLGGIGHEDTVAITFDDGPDPSSTPQILDELERLALPATFFLLGSMVRKAPQLARELIDRGHEVGLHGHVHQSHLSMNPAAVYNDLRTSFDVISEATGVPLTLFRPPYGSLSGGSLFAARRLGLRTVLWTACGRDWRAEATPTSILSDLQSDLKGGATILLHDSDCTSSHRSWTSTLGVLPLLARELEAKDLTPMLLSSHLRNRKGPRRRPSRPQS